MNTEDYAFLLLMFCAVYILHFLVDNWSYLSNNELPDQETATDESLHAFLRVKLKDAPKKTINLEIF